MIGSHNSQHVEVKYTKLCKVFAINAISCNFNEIELTLIIDYHNKGFLKVYVGNNYMASDTNSNISAIADENHKCGTVDGKQTNNICCNNTLARFVILKAVTGVKEDSLFIGWVDIKEC